LRVRAGLGVDAEGLGVLITTLGFKLDCLALRGATVDFERVTIERLQ
jgi:hypothetical protein